MKYRMVLLYLQKNLPVLPLKSSSASGFFFCGIREDPVQYASDMLRHFCIFNMITSSANCDIWTIRRDAQDMNSA